MTIDVDRPGPYVGVSGITTPEQAEAILDMWPENAPPGSLMLGVLTSQKVMTGGERNARSAAPEDFESLLLLHDYRVLGLVHYFTRDTRNLGEQLLHAAAPGGVGCDGVQINVPWPPPVELEHFRQWGDYSSVVLQLGPKVLESASLINIAERLDREYRDIITDALIDVSGGGGKGFDPLWASEAVEEIRRWNPEVGIGIAGGLCAETLPAVADLVRKHGLSIDAEGRLRNDRDELDLDKVRAYLDAAARLWGWR